MFLSASPGSNPSARPSRNAAANSPSKRNETASSFGSCRSPRRTTRSTRSLDSPWLLEPMRGIRPTVSKARTIISVFPVAVVARRFLIGGRVQGVGFRMFAADRAAREGLTGYARNLPDGRVEALVEGDQESVDRMELALRRGPSHAEVASFDVEIVEPTRRHVGFSTR